MGIPERYISEVGARSGDAMKEALWELLQARYVAVDQDADYPQKLAASVVDYLFCEPSKNSELRAFRSEHEAVVISKARELANDESLCRVLTAAVYNFSYGRYVDSGRKIGFLFNNFHGYVRALQQPIMGHYSNYEMFVNSFIEKVGWENAEPLSRLMSLGIFRPLPHTPDEQVLMREIASFIVKLRVDASLADLEAGKVFCTKCGMALQIDSQFCSNCGAKQPSKAA